MKAQVVGFWRRRIMATHISRGTRFFGLDVLEWLMLVAAILLISIVALVV
jgi:hypothetical protein